jgi:hypothetical protein
MSTKKPKVIQIAVSAGAAGLPDGVYILTEDGRVYEIWQETESEVWHWRPVSLPDCVEHGSIPAKEQST